MFLIFMTISKQISLSRIAMYKFEFSSLKTKYIRICMLKARTFGLLKVLETKYMIVYL